MLVPISEIIASFACFVDHLADNEKGQQVYDDEEDAVGYNYSFFHFMLMLASLYAMMVLTSWYK